MVNEYFLVVRCPYCGEVFDAISILQIHQMRSSLILYCDAQCDIEMLHVNDFKVTNCKHKKKNSDNTPVPVRPGSVKTLMRRIPEKYHKTVYKLLRRVGVNHRSRELEGLKTFKSMVQHLMDIPLDEVEQYHIAHEDDEY